MTLRNWGFTWELPKNLTSRVTMSDCLTLHSKLSAANVNYDRGSTQQMHYDKRRLSTLELIVIDIVQKHRWFFGKIECFKVSMLSWTMWKVEQSEVEAKNTIRTFWVRDSPWFFAALMLIYKKIKTMYWNNSHFFLNKFTLERSILRRWYKPRYRNRLENETEVWAW